MKLNYKRTFFVGLAFFGILAFWQLYDGIVPKILTNTFHMGETLRGVVMAADNVLALFLLPFFGTLSDKVKTPLGKRIPFVLVGTILAVIFMTLLPIADNTVNLPLFLIALFFTLISMGIYRSPAVALMPDLTPNRLRSKANAIINLMGYVGGIITLLLISFLVKKVDKPDYTVLFACVAGLMVVSVVILLLTIKENRMREEMIAQEAALGAEEAKIAEVAEKAEAAPAEEAEATEAEAAPAAEAKEENKLAPEVKKSMYFILFSVFFWYMAYNAVSSTFSVYAEEMWGMKGGSFAGCLTVATAAAIISFVPLGFISAKFGRKKTIMAGVLVMAACFSVAIFVTAYHPLVNIIFASIGIGWAAINVNSYPMIMAMSKGSDVGKFTGTYYTFSMAAQILTPILSGFFLEYVSNRSLFVYALIFSLVAFLTMSFVKHGDVKPEKKESLLENFDVED